MSKVMSKEKRERMKDARKIIRSLIFQLAMKELVTVEQCHKIVDKAFKAKEITMSEATKSGRS